MRVREFLEDVVPGDLHEKRVQGLAAGVEGVLHAASLSVSAIGKGYAAVNGSSAKHGIKQVDRLLSNAGVVVWDLFQSWVPFVVGDREELLIALDWTEFDKDAQSTIGACLVSSHGRATPLIWKTEKKALLTDGGRSDEETFLLYRLREVLPAGRRVTLIADRGFGDQALYQTLMEWGWDFVIRFRDCIHVTDAKGETRPAKEWLLKSGRARMLKSVGVTVDQTPIAAVVCVHAKDMKDPWCLATSRADLSATQVVKLYGRRFTIEETFRDLKDPRYGFGLVSHRVSKPERRDRLILLFAITHALLTLLGAASERIGYDRMLRANTVKTRTHSLFTQGSFYFDALPNMSEEKARPLMDAFDEVIREHAFFRHLYGIL
jgi:Transposase DDE domain